MKAVEILDLKKIYKNGPEALKGVSFSIQEGKLFGSLGVIVGVLSDTFDQMSAVSNFVIQPLIYLGGVFYSIQFLPSPLNTLSQFNPMVYVINVFRWGFLGNGDESLSLSFGITLLLALTSFCIAWRLFATGYKLKT